METQRMMVPKWTHQVKVFNDAIKSLEAIKVIADKFDGKVINKRFITKLNEISDRNIIIFSLEEEGYDKIAGINEKVVSLYLTDRCFKNDSGSWSYIDEDSFNILEANKKDFYINKDGRLVKEYFIQGIDKTIENFKARIAQYQDCIDHFDEYMAEVKKINAEIDELRNKVHFPMSIFTGSIQLPFYY